MKRVGINLLYLIPGKVGGTEYYGRGFVEETIRKKKKNEKIFLFCNQENSFLFQKHALKATIVVCPVQASNRISRIIFEQGIFPFLLRKYRITQLHSLAYFGPILAPCWHSVVVHDANWKDHPEDFSFVERAVWKALVESLIKSADEIYTDSDFSFSRLAHHFPEYLSKISLRKVAFQKESALPLRKQKRELPLFGRPFFLCVSAYYPHKRMMYLYFLWRYLSRLFPHHYLVVVGRNGREEKKVKALLKTLHRVYVFDHLPSEQLANYYAHAEACIQPSIYEGFGYPVYEATTAKKTVFVGKKSLYSKEVQKNLRELIYVPRRDAWQFYRAIKADHQSF